MTALGWQQLVHQKVRLGVAIAGIAFAVVLILMQLGFRASLLDSSVRYHEGLRYDVALVSVNTLFIAQTEPFSIRRLYQALGVPGVVAVSPAYVSRGMWRNPFDHEPRNIFVVGIDPSDAVLDAPGVLAGQHLVRRRDAVLFDALSRPEYGPIGEVFRQRGPLRTEVNDRDIEVVGLFEMGTSFGIDGSILTSDDNFLRLFPQRARNQVDIGLVRLSPGQDPQAVARRIAEALPDDVVVVTRAGFVARERAYWLSTTPIGAVFSFGVVIGLVVGAIVVYQILFADVSEHLPEYATLKAMGYSNRFLSGVVIQQAVVLAVLGYLPGAAICLWLYDLVGEATRLPMVLPWQRAASVLGLTVAMCSVAGLLALRKVRSLDPADVF